MTEGTRAVFTLEDEEQEETIYVTANHFSNVAVTTLRPQGNTRQAVSVLVIRGDNLQKLKACMRKPTKGTVIELDVVAAPHVSEPLASCRAVSCASGRFRSNLEELQMGPSHPWRTLSLHWTARCKKPKACHFDVLAAVDKSASEFAKAVRIQRGEGSGKCSSQRETLKWT